MAIQTRWIFECPHQIIWSFSCAGKYLLARPKLAPTCPLKTTFTKKSTLLLWSHQLVVQSLENSVNIVKICTSTILLLARTRKRISKNPTTLQLANIGQTAIITARSGLYTLRAVDYPIPNAVQRQLGLEAPYLARRSLVPLQTLSSQANVHKPWKHLGY